MIRALLTWALLVPPPAAGDLYRFPSTDEHYGHYYVTAYYDHSGVDWNCGSKQYSGHRGSDFGVGSWTGMDAGRDLVAAAAGTVVYAHDGEADRCSTGDCGGGGGYGNYVKLEHDDGRFTYYAHMRQWTVAVSTGDRLRCGDYIGQVGSSGNSTGPHLHYEVREASGDRVDPFDGDCAGPPAYWVDQGAYQALPSITCEDIPPCAPMGRLTCGQEVQGRNDQDGSTREHSFYGCTEWLYTGPEVAWWFSTSLDEPVTLSLSGLSADLDLYALSSEVCDGTGCLASSSNPNEDDEELTIQASAGVDYLVVVDGWEGSASEFVLGVACEGAVDTGIQDTGRPRHGDTGGPPGRRTRIVETDGLGCAAGHSPPGWPAALLVLSALTARRRARGVRAGQPPAEEAG